jgi:hypothetical protein
VILFGLSMDYHVFIISRIRETFDRGASMDDAITHGIKTTAGVVTSAAIVVVAVFSIFATLSMLMFKQFGVGLAAAILIDATIVRGVLLPATMKLLGERNWYLPAGSSGCRASSTRSRRRRRPRRRTRLPLQRSALHGSRPRIDAAGTGWPSYEVGSGLMIPNVAPCGSRSTARRPTLGTSIGSRSVAPPRSVAFAVVASGSSTAT